MSFYFLKQVEKTEGIKKTKDIKKAGDIKKTEDIKRTGEQAKKIPHYRFDDRTTNLSQPNQRFTSCASLGRGQVSSCLMGVDDTAYEVDISEPNASDPSAYEPNCRESNYCESETVKKMVLKMQESLWVEQETSDTHSAKIKSPELYKTADPSVVTREKLKRAWEKMHKIDSDSVDMALSPLQRRLASPMFAHNDVYHFCSSWKDQGEQQRLYCLHILNEVLGQRARIIRNNEKLVECADTEARDQGFTRPRVLIMAPFRNTAFDIVRVLGSIWQAMGGQVDNQKRLVDEFGPDEDEEESSSRHDRPEDFAHSFRDNIDDCFRVGIKFTRKSMKLFCDFYSSDVIIASPLGLRFIIDGQSEVKKINLGHGRSKKKRIVKKGDYDFLSSIQMLIVEQADIISMQNWEHLQHVLSHLNKLPKGSHGCDFSRVQNIFLDELASKTRQNILFSEYVFPELNGILKGLENCVGKWQYSVREYEGLLKKVKNVKPQFHLVDAPSFGDLPSIRFQYFVEKILPKYIQSASHICIFVSSYLDFVQIREHLQKLELSHAVLSEYSSQKEMSAARTMFFNGQARFMLVSERFHFFKRYRIRGIKELIFYSLPDHSAYYEDWCSMLKDAIPVPVILSKFDYLKAERIIGTKRIPTLFQD